MIIMSAPRDISSNIDSHLYFELNHNQVSSYNLEKRPLCVSFAKDIDTNQPVYQNVRFPSQRA